MAQLFVDMDGVLADFDRHHEAVFGYRADKVQDNVDWKAVRRISGFYEAIPPMGDLDVLWAFVSPFKPIVLTGVPTSVEEAPDNKRAWVQKHLGDHIEVRCCKSREKYLHCNSNDVLIDDWEKYMHLWIGAGGHWITHTSALSSISRLEALEFGERG